jgi:hypothetical protein
MMKTTNRNKAPDPVPLEGIDEAAREYLETETWETGYWARDIAPEKRQAAKLIAEAIDPSRIERMMRLPRGQLAAWWEDDEGFQRAAKASYWERRDQDARVIDYGQGLKPKQLEAATLYFVEGRQQIEVAKIVGVTDRTIRTWLKDAVFVRYGRQLARERADQRLRQRQDRDAALLERRDGQFERAQEVVDDALDEGDRRVAVAILRPLLGRD